MRKVMKRPFSKAIFSLVLFMAASQFAVSQSLNLVNNGDWVGVGDLDVSGNKLTVEALIYLETNAVLQNNVVSKHTQPGDLNYLLRPLTLEISTYVSGNSGPYKFLQMFNPFALQPQKWYHIAGTYDGAFVKYYVDGCVVIDTPWTGNLIQNNLSTSIGNQSNCQCEQFFGKVDEVRIWNVCRSEAEIKANMLNLPNPTTQTGLLAYYKFIGDFTNAQGNTAWNGVAIGSPTFSTAAATVQPFSITSVIINNSDCVKSKNGSIAVTSSNPAATYSINGTTYQNGNLFSTLIPGAYKVYAKSPEGCILDTLVNVGNDLFFFKDTVRKRLCINESYEGHFAPAVLLDTVSSTTGCDTLKVTILSLDTTCTITPVCGTPGIDGPANDSVVNTYYPPKMSSDTVKAGTKTVQLGAVPPVDAYGNSFGNEPIKPGDKLLFIQVQDGSINTSNSNLYGSGNPKSGPDSLGGTGYTSLGSAGLYEYVIVENAVPLTGGTLQFKGGGRNGGLVNTYTNYPGDGISLGKKTFQVLRVPQYSSLKLTTDIICPPFNGNVGGIIAFDVAGDFDFNGHKVDASKKGFRGGFLFDNTSGCNSSLVYITTNKTLSSGKGESVLGTPRYMWNGYSALDNGTNWKGFPGPYYGRGAAGNGGGGGNDHNAGGGGGGNRGAGGCGGLGCSTFPCPGSCSGDPGAPNGGRPGGEISFRLPDRIIMGGGGGGGDANDATSGTKGGVGGGIILINAGRIGGVGNLLSNGGNGQVGKAGINPDGAGGGGAGGTIIISSVNGSSGANIVMKVNGGSGGNTENDGPYPHGPGGGGGGGVIWHNVQGATLNVEVKGGASGLTNNGNPGSTSHGADSGQNGSVRIFTNDSLPIYLQGQAANCLPALTVTKSELHAGPGGARTAGNKAIYTITVSNAASGGGAGGVSVSDALPGGFTLDSASVSYTGGATGPLTTPHNAGSNSYPVFDTFNIPAGGKVIIKMFVQIVASVPPKVYHNGAQALYLDPTRTTANPARKITAATNALPGQNTTYESGVNAGVSVPGTNYSADTAALHDEDVYIIPPGSIADTIKVCTGSTAALTVTPPTATAPFTFNWSGPAGTIFSPNNTVQQPTIANVQSSNAGTYKVVVTDANGFTSTYTTVLVLSTSTRKDTSVRICKNKTPLVWCGQSLTTTGTYYCIDSSKVCRDSVVLNLQVDSAYKVFKDTFVCSNLFPFVWHGQTINKADTFYHNYYSQLGCDSIVALIVHKNTAYPNVPHDTTVCSNSFPFVWNGQTITGAGIYSFNYRTVAGCDSIVFLKVMQSPSYQLQTDTAVCSNRFPFTRKGTVISGPGTYTFNNKTIIGCDSTEVLNVTIKSIATSTTLKTICKQDLPYNWNNIVCNAAGPYSKTLQAANGCDSIATLVLTVSEKPDVYVDTASFCMGSKTTIEATIRNNVAATYMWNANSSLNKRTLDVNITGRYFIKASNQCGFDTASVFVYQRICKLRIPNVFSPNGDGVNDLWRISGLSDFPGAVVTIFTRYGGEILFSKKADNAVWDGIHNGKPVPTGVYYYVIDHLGTGVMPISGWVTILR